MNPQLEDIYKIVSYGTEVKITTPMSVYLEKNKDLFQDKQEALANLKKDSELEIIEEEEKIQSEHGVHWYKIITIRLKKKPEII